MFKGMMAAILVVAGLLPAEGGETKATPSWPIYHGDAALCGVAETSLPEKLSVLWRFKVGAPVSVSPVVSDGRIFFVSEHGEAFAVNMQGGKIWSVSLKKEPAANTNAMAQVERFSTQPVCVRDVLLAGSDSGNLYALETATGKVKWKYQVGENINSTANWIEPENGQGYSVIVMSQSDGVVHRVDLATGKKIWVSQPVSRSDGSPGVGKDFIVFGSCDAALHVMSAGKGEITGRVGFEGDGQVAGGVAIVDDMAFAGTRGGLAVCVDVKKLAVIWTNQVGNSESFATPAVTGDRVITGSNDGKIYCLNRVNGKKIWSFNVDGNPLSPVVAGDKVVVSSGGTLYILKLENGAKLWADKAADLISSPAVVDGKVIIGTDDGFVVMYGEGK